MNAFQQRARQVRRGIVDMLASAGRGHLASALSVVEILIALYDHVLKIKPEDPAWPKRDRFILSKGHGCMALYVLLSDNGFFDSLELEKFCMEDGILGGHPEHGKVPGVEASTGALGHGLSLGVGMALNACMEDRDYRTFVLLGDGECNEGSVWEAAMAASKHRLSSLLAIIDHNRFQSYGLTADVLDLEPFKDKWRSFGWEVHEADGHDLPGLVNILSGVPFHPEKPGVLICNTVKGKGVASAENNPAWHHKSRVTSDELETLYRELDMIS